MDSLAGYTITTGDTMNELEAFRQETRAWLESNCPPSMRTPMPSDEIVWGGRTVEFKHEDQRLWFERMRDKGWFCPDWPVEYGGGRSEEHTSELQSRENLVCRLLLEKKNTTRYIAC